MLLTVFCSAALAVAELKRLKGCHPPDDCIMEPGEAEPCKAPSECQMDPTHNPFRCKNPADCERLFLMGPPWSGGSGSNGTAPAFCDKMPKMKQFLPICGGQIPSMDEICDKLPDAATKYIPSCGGSLPGDMGQKICDKVPEQMQQYVPICGGKIPTKEEICGKIPDQFQKWFPACKDDDTPGDAGSNAAWGNGTFPGGDFCDKVPEQFQQYIPICGGEIPSIDEICGKLPDEVTKLIPACGGSLPGDMGEKICAKVPEPLQQFLPVCGGKIPTKDEICGMIPDELTKYIPACGGSIPDPSAFCGMVPDFIVKWIPMCGGNEPTGKVPGQVMQGVCKMVPPAINVHIPACIEEFNAVSGKKKGSALCNAFPGFCTPWANATEAHAAWGAICELPSPFDMFQMHCKEGSTGNMTDLCEDMPQWIGKFITPCGGDPTGAVDKLCSAIPTFVKKFLGIESCMAEGDEDEDPDTTDDPSTVGSGIFGPGPAGSRDMGPGSAPDGSQDFGPGLNRILKRLRSGARFTGQVGRV